MTFDIIKAIILGVVEGLTEFRFPVSSTGHLLLMQRFFGFGDDDFGKSFAFFFPVRCDPRPAVDLFRAPVAIVHRHVRQSAGAAFYSRRADRLLAGGGGAGPWLTS